MPDVIQRASCDWSAWKMIFAPMPSRIMERPIRRTRAFLNAVCLRMCDYCPKIWHLLRLNAEE